MSSFLEWPSVTLCFSSFQPPYWSMATCRYEYHSHCVREKQLRKAIHCSEFTWLLFSPQVENFQGCAVRRMLYQSSDWHERALQMQNSTCKHENLQKQVLALTSADPISPPHHPRLLCKLNCSTAASRVRRVKKIRVSTECSCSLLPHIFRACC